MLGILSMPCSSAALPATLHLFVRKLQNPNQERHAWRRPSISAALTQTRAISGKSIASVAARVGGHAVSPHNQLTEAFPNQSLPSAFMAFWELAPRGLHWTTNGREPYASPAIVHAVSPPRLSSARHIAVVPPSHPRGCGGTDGPERGILPANLSRL